MFDPDMLITYECECGKEQLPIKRFINKHGFVEINPNWQCPTCWDMIQFYIEKDNDENQDSHV